MYELWLIGGGAGMATIRCLAVYPSVARALAAASAHGPGKYEVTTHGHEIETHQTAARLTLPELRPMAQPEPRPAVVADRVTWESPLPAELARA